MLVMLVMVRMWGPEGASEKKVRDLGGLVGDWICGWLGDFLGCF